MTLGQALARIRVIVRLPGVSDDRSQDLSHKQLFIKGLPAGLFDFENEEENDDISIQKQNYNPVGVFALDDISCAYDRRGNRDRVQAEKFKVSEAQHPSGR
ncbi:MAG TPA: hypothetical protein VJS37_02545 [Terriglobales bacterium]|nr:hypothetical protein [Terriglobales bacterium]